MSNKREKCVVHRYKKHPKQKDVFFCTAPHCYHKADKAILKGKANLCAKCGEEHILGTQELTMVEPKCLNCASHKAARMHQMYKKAMSINLDELMKPDVPMFDDFEEEVESSGK